MTAYLVFGRIVDELVEYGEYDAWLERAYAIACAAFEGN